MARRLGASHMRMAGAVGGVVACVGAGAAVTASPKPAGAPLTPPVDTSVAVDRSTPVATPCPANSPGMATTPPDPAVAAALRAIRAASTAAQRQAVLRGLTPDQRQQVTALLRRSASGVAASPAPGCAAAQPQPVIQPDVVDATPGAQPVTSSYVS